MATRISNLTIASLVLALGCAHAAATTRSTAAPARIDVPFPQQAPATSNDLDSTEEITPGELASIPDPVPNSAPPPSTPTPVAATPRAPDDSVPDSDVAAVPPDSPADDHHWVWRVQIFASPDLAQAGRIAKEASAQFGEPSMVEFEGALYKVRLGAFASEGLAQSLRERAVEAGYPGAFRMRSAAP